MIYKMNIKTNDRTNESRTEEELGQVLFYDIFWVRVAYSTCTRNVWGVSWAAHALQIDRLKASGV